MYIALSLTSLAFRLGSSSWELILNSPCLFTKHMYVTSNKCPYSQVFYCTYNCSYISTSLVASGTQFSVQISQQRVCGRNNGMGSSLTRDKREANIDNLTLAQTGNTIVCSTSVSVDKSEKHSAYIHNNTLAIQFTLLVIVLTDCQASIVTFVAHNIEKYLSAAAVVR